MPKHYVLFGKMWRKNILHLPKLPSMYMNLNEENSENIQNKVKIDKYACSS